MRVLITGATGRLGAHVMAILNQTAHDVIGWTSSSELCQTENLLTVEIRDPEWAERALGTFKPQGILHLAAVSSPASVKAHPTHSWAVNVNSTEQLAEWCTRREARLVFTSTDLMFDGARGLYLEDEPTSPSGEYGRTKEAAGQVLSRVPRGLVARMSLMFGPTCNGRRSYFDQCIDSLRQGESQSYFHDEFRTPLDYESAARILVQLLELEATGILHVGGSERMSRYDLMSRIAPCIGGDPSLVCPNSIADQATDEPRAADVSLVTSKLMRLLPDLERPSVEQAAARWNLAR